MESSATPIIIADSRSCSVSISGPVKTSRSACRYHAGRQRERQCQRSQAGLAPACADGGVQQREHREADSLDPQNCQGGQGSVHADPNATPGRRKQRKPRLRKSLKCQSRANSTVIQPLRVNPHRQGLLVRLPGATACFAPTNWRQRMSGEGRPHALGLATVRAGGGRLSSRCSEADFGERSWTATRSPSMEPSEWRLETPLPTFVRMASFETRFVSCSCFGERQQYGAERGAAR